MHIKSNLHKITIVIPQDSILGPFLFFLYINDISKISENFESLLYADDTALFFKADSIIAGPGSSVGRALDSVW